MTDDSSSGRSTPSVTGDGSTSWSGGTGALEASRHRPSYAVITRLAEADACSPLELPPLHETIDVDALDGLFERRSSPPLDTDSDTGDPVTSSTVTVSFSHADHRIRVDGDGTIAVSPSSEEADADAVDEWDHVSTVRTSGGHDVASRVVVAIAESTDHRPSSVRSALADRLDLESLAQLNRPRANGVPRSGASVRFSLLGYDVVVEPDGTVAVGSSLCRLKRTGGNVLVVGAVPDALVDTISARLLGGPERRAIFALLDREVNVVADRLSATRASNARVLNHASATTARSASAASVTRERERQGNREPASGPTVTAVTGDLEDLAAAIETTLAEAAATGGLEPGDVRLCVDSLRPILEESDADGPPAVLAEMCESATNAGTLAHYVLPLARESDPVRTIEPVFDATVELRVNGTVPEQRWHVHESAYATEWFPVRTHAEDER